MTEQEKYEKDLEEWKEETLALNTRERERYIKIHGVEIDKMDKWLMAIAAGSFGLSFAFIDNIVPVKEAVCMPYLIYAWSSFLAILILGISGFFISARNNWLLADEINGFFPLINEGKTPEYKKRGILFYNINKIIGYTQIILFIGGCVCLIVFVGRNLL